MDWLFGRKAPTIPQTAVPEPVDVVQQRLHSGAGSPGGLYDPEVLERISKAANELREHPEAAGIVKLVAEQERTWQAKLAKDQADAVLQGKVRDAQLAVLQQEERRKTIEMESEHAQHRSQFEDKLARERYDDQLKQQHAHVDRERQLRQQQVQREEEEKRRTVEYAEQLRRETELLKLKSEGVARAEQERLNKDIRAEQIVLTAAETRKTVMEAIVLTGRTVGEGVTTFLSDPRQVGLAVGVVTALAAGIYAARSGASVAGQYVSKRLAQPPLVRETSRVNPLLHPVKALRLRMRKSGDNPLEGIVLEESMKRRLRDVTLATAHTRRHGATYRNLMLYGPPGTGKTMFARRLAQQSGLEFAVLAGGDIGPLGASAVTELHRVFDWGEASNKGLLLFVDEADAFLRKRGDAGDGQMSESLRNALSTFLFRTGSPSSKTMLVFATNEPAAFDRAVLDRVDESVEFALPGPSERAAIFQKYFAEYVVGGAPGARKIRVDDDITNTAVYWEEMAARTSGFSGRQIMKLCNAWQASAYSSVDNSLTIEALETVLKHHIDQLLQFETWDKMSLSKAN